MSDPKAEVLQSIPAASAIGIWLTGKDINFWVGVGGLVFLVLQCGYLIWKWRRDIRNDSIRAGLNDED